MGPITLQNQNFLKNFFKLNKMLNSRFMQLNFIANQHILLAKLWLDNNTDNIIKTNTLINVCC